MILLNPLLGIKEYVEWLEERELLVRVKEPLSPILEIPYFLRKVMYSSGPAVLFESVKGFEGWRVCGNLFPSVFTISSALGINSFEEISERLISLITHQQAQGITEKIKAFSDASKLLGYFPKKVNKAEFEEKVIEGKDNPLDKIPFFKTWPMDGGRYATFPMVITKDPAKGIINMGVYRVMIVNGRKGIIHWQVHKRGAMAYSVTKEMKAKEMPVAIIIGSDPGTMISAVSPVPYPIDKMLFAGMVRGRGVELFELDNGIPVPSNSEIVIEGSVRVDELASEGPFGDHWGYYDTPTEMYPVFTVERVYMRENPIYYGSVTGLPPLEDAVMGKIVEKMFKPFIKLLLPEVVDISYPVYGIFQGMVVVSIKKRYPGQAKKVMNALWGLAQSSLTKIVIVVDEDIDVNNLDKVIWAVSSNVEPQRDVVVIPYTHTDALDPASISHSYGGKLGIDATRKLPEENFGREWPKIVEDDKNVKEKIDPLVEKLLKSFKGLDRF
ncbi:MULTISPECIES: UbiD family decarboxylase [Fervidicoccus]|uniref:Anhydromevalonate phosphate decarboxylase n=1 Tax=Fervidicoccus fontis (strain DSM 19380 / JCM 18336 / VKM B-2539 / Kam940) TaxID=1163730 RepID=I0A1Q0_FERFK|nr:3-octaprenyl-4-hydroxybenzoate carboxy-lyase [Fervidicoccus fontis Kam940]